MKVEKFNKIFPQIELAFKNGVVDICPNCKKATKVYPNPYYHHECEHCGWKGSYNECLSKTSKDFISEILNVK